MGGILPRERIAAALEEMASITDDKPNRALERIANAVETMQESGGVGGNIMIVHFGIDYSTSTVTADKTFSEVATFAQNGGIVVGMYTGGAQIAIYYLTTVNAVQILAEDSAFYYHVFMSHGVTFDNSNELSGATSSAFVMCDDGTNLYSASL